MSYLLFAWHGFLGLSSEDIEGFFTQTHDKENGSCFHEEYMGYQAKMSSWLRDKLQIIPVALIVVAS